MSVDNILPNGKQMDELIAATDRRPTKEQFDKMIPAELALDGTEATYRAQMRRWFIEHGAFSAAPAQLTKLCDEWYEITRPRWHGWSTFYMPGSSDVSTGTKGGDNAGLVCTPSTDTAANRDDYAGNPLFVPTDVNWQVNADTLDIEITQIAGITAGFERSNPKKLVGVMQMSGYVYNTITATNETTGYSSTPDIQVQGLEKEGGACRPDGSFRPWRVAAKYPNRTVDGKGTSYAGGIPTAWMSHNSAQTLFKSNGAQYSGECSVDVAWLQLMMRIKYASLTMDTVVAGCSANNWKYPAAASEAGVKRVLVTTAQGANISKGMGVLIGNTTGNADRGQAGIYSITGQKGAIVTDVQTVSVSGTQYTAVYVDTDAVFSTTSGASTTATGTTVISSFHWPNGTTDSVKGNDGSPVNCTSGKYPAKLQGIEYMVGGYEVLNDAIILLSGSEAAGYTYEPWVVLRSAKQSTSITEDYKASGAICPQDGAAAWKYIRHLAFKNGLWFPDTVGGSSTTRQRDAIYQSAGATRAEREWLAFGALYDGVAGAGVSCLVAGDALSDGYWCILARLSANGNRGELAA